MSKDSEFSPLSSLVECIELFSVLINIRQGASQISMTSMKNVLKLMQETALDFSISGWKLKVEI